MGARFKAKGSLKGSPMGARKKRARLAARGILEGGPARYKGKKTRTQFPPKRFQELTAAADRPLTTPPPTRQRSRRAQARRSRLAT